MANLLDRSIPPASDLETLVNLQTKLFILRLVVIDNELFEYIRI